MAEPLGRADAARVLAGLRATPKTLSPTLFYDDAGAALFAAISRLPSYYLTRAEHEILAARATELAALLGPAGALIEYGSGEATKVRHLLDARRAAGDGAPTYVPVDVSHAQLHDVAARLAAAYPGLGVAPVVGDYLDPAIDAAIDRAIAATTDEASDAMAGGEGARRRRVAFFPGSTIGNLEPDAAVALLARIGRTVARGGPGGALVLGADLRKDPAVLHAAYNDPEGVTAAFNRNLLVRLNRELGATFDPATFDHYAFYQPVAGRVEMHLVSRVDQTVHVAGEPVAFAAGETLWTEVSYKYTRAVLDALAARAGLAITAWWTDAAERFAVAVLAAAPAGAPMDAPS